MQFLLLGHSTREFASLLGAITIFSGLTVLYVGMYREIYCEDSAHFVHTSAQALAGSF